jgi:hypothetical protein
MADADMRKEIAELDAKRPKQCMQREVQESVGPKVDQVEPATGGEPRPVRGERRLKAGAASRRGLTSSAHESAKPLD